MASQSADTPESLRGLCAAHQSVYGFLAACFARPLSPREWEAANRAGTAEAHAPPCDDELSAMLQKLTSYYHPQASEQEFMALFKVPGGRYVAPYESVFRDVREIEGQRVGGLLLGQSAVDVQKWYRLAALEFKDDCKELPDHIALELEYLAHLCGKECEFTAAGDAARVRRAQEMQRDFLAAHVCSWIGALRDRIVEKARSPFYGTVADMAVAFTTRHLSALEQTIGPSQRSSSPPYRQPPD
jgi:TorA maturation chaperone TorD